MTKSNNSKAAMLPFPGRSQVWHSVGRCLSNEAGKPDSRIPLSAVGKRNEIPTSSHYIGGVMNQPRLAVRLRLSTASRPATVQAFRWANLNPRGASALSEPSVDLGDPEAWAGRGADRFSGTAFRARQDPSHVHQAKVRMSMAEAGIFVAETAWRRFEASS
jgi:hypothetical protein